MIEKIEQGKEKHFRSIRLWVKNSLSSYQDLPKKSLRSSFLSKRFLQIHIKYHKHTEEHVRRYYDVNI